jgi:hypothetical protein
VRSKIGEAWKTVELENSGLRRTLARPRVATLGYRESLQWSNGSYLGPSELNHVLLIITVLFEIVRDTVALTKTLVAATSSSTLNRLGGKRHARQR